MCHGVVTNVFILGKNFVEGCCPVYITNFPIVTKVRWKRYVCILEFQVTLKMGSSMETGKPMKA